MWPAVSFSHGHSIYTSMGYIPWTVHPNRSFLSYDLMDLRKDSVHVLCPNSDESATQWVYHADGLVTFAPKPWRERRERPHSYDGTNSWCFAVALGNRQHNHRNRVCEHTEAQKTQVLSTRCRREGGEGPSEPGLQWNRAFWYLQSWTLERSETGLQKRKCPPTSNSS